MLKIKNLNSSITKTLKMDGYKTQKCKPIEEAIEMNLWAPVTEPLGNGPVDRQQFGYFIRRVINVDDR